MSKYQVYWDNLEDGNYYSFYVKAENEEQAIHIVWENKIEPMNLTTGNYVICVRKVK